jgi:hypothetical protein
MLIRWVAGDRFQPVPDEDTGWIVGMSAGVGSSGYGFLTIWTALITARKVWG